jgi:hypothetical protein
MHPWQPGKQLQPLAVESYLKPWHVPQPQDLYQMDEQYRPLPSQLVWMEQLHQPVLPHLV